MFVVDGWCVMAHQKIALTNEEILDANGKSQTLVALKGMDERSRTHKRTWTVWRTEKTECDNNSDHEKSRPAWSASCLRPNFSTPRTPSMGRKEGAACRYAFGEVSGISSNSLDRTHFRAFSNSMCDHSNVVERKSHRSSA